MADRSVVTRDESYGSEDSQALMFCFDRKVLLCHQSGVLCFALLKRFCVRKCYQNGAKFSTVERMPFSFPSSHLKEKQTKEKEFTIAEGTVKGFFRYISADYRLKYLRKCVSDRI